MVKYYSIALLVLALLAPSVNAFAGMSTMKRGDQRDTTSLAAGGLTDKSTMLSRSSFVAGTVGALIMTPATAALARGVKDANLEGTESQANAKACVDRCLYEKIKAGKSKEDSLKICTDKCNSAEGQMTSFTPGE